MIAIALVLLAVVGIFIVGQIGADAQNRANAKSHLDMVNSGYFGKK